MFQELANNLITRMTAIGLTVKLSMEDNRLQYKATVGRTGGPVGTAHDWAPTTAIEKAYADFLSQPQGTNNEDPN